MLYGSDKTPGLEMGWKRKERETSSDSANDAMPKSRRGCAKSKNRKYGLPAEDKESTQGGWKN